LACTKETTTAAAAAAATALRQQQQQQQPGITQPPMSKHCGAHQAQYQITSLVSPSLQQ